LNDNDQIPAAFEWDEHKAKLNEADPERPTFEAGMSVFRDEGRLVDFDCAHSNVENRYNVIGVVDGLCLHVSFAWRGHNARLIYVRRANQKERRIYDYSKNHGRGEGQPL
jgi:uncharacterized DUF497 family protein